MLEGIRLRWVRALLMRGEWSGRGWSSVWNRGRQQSFQGKVTAVDLVTELLLLLSIRWNVWVTHVRGRDLAEMKRDMVRVHRRECHRRRHRFGWSTDRTARGWNRQTDRLSLRRSWE